ncbi:hypothetical protein [Pseudomonas phoenicis]|uniref:hypothetical protein n=1 Tax=unclassified Pseudomonas TaxID=196821 RepID=UPI0039A1EA47
MNIEDQVLMEIKRFSPQPNVIEDWEPIADILSTAFPWQGSKIAWGRLNWHRTQPIDLRQADCTPQLNAFLKAGDVLSKLPEHGEIFYINDAALNVALSIRPEIFPAFLAYVVNDIPQHHYFFDSSGTWCFAVTAEGYLDFGGNRQMCY